MGKSRAEIQREYRARKKAKLGDAYLQKERERVRNYYIPAKELSLRQRRERNEKMKIKNKRSRARAKERLEILKSTSGVLVDAGPSTSDSGTAHGSAKNKERMVVRLPSISLMSKARGGRKNRDRALARARKSINLLEKQKSELEKKLRRKSKQLDRMRSKIDKSAKSPNTPQNVSTETLTPRRKTNHEVEKLHLTPRRRRTVAKKLLMTNVLLAEVKKAKIESSKKKRKILHNIVAGQISRKYKCMNSISTETGLSRRVLQISNSKSLITQKERRRCVAKKHEQKVIEFLSREDNCRTQPGKADSKKGHQTKVLTDYLQNLWRKFSAENPEINISLATFCRLRPNYILLARFISRNACQCLKHQNMAMKVQAMRKVGLKISENPENICVQRENLNELIAQIPNEVDHIKYRMWKKVELENKIKKMMVVENEISRDEFEEMMKKEVAEFAEHVSRLRTQYQQLKVNKETLSKDHVIIQMDFAENYTCRTLDEVQTAYWSLTSVTLHPIVMYYNDNGALRHRSYVIISDTMVHSASTVSAFLDEFYKDLKKDFPTIQKVHYWTDSPSSQYRNRFMFNILADHTDLYGCDAQWNYFEAGHGKSACDGLGGTTKRMADEASRQGNTVIQNAGDFYSWACNSSMKDVKFLFVSKRVCEQKQAMFVNLGVKPVRNTMKLHAVAFGDRERGKGTIRTNETSCYCEYCRKGAFCDKWGMEKFSCGGKEVEQSNHIVSFERETTGNPVGVEQGAGESASILEEKADDVQEQKDFFQFENIQTNDYVIAVYEEQAYIGKVLEIDEEDKDCKITFMEKAKELYRWPRQEDIIWISQDKIVTKIVEPVQTGKSKRLFKISDATNDIMNEYSR